MKPKKMMSINEVIGRLVTLAFKLSMSDSEDAKENAKAVNIAIDILSRYGDDGK